MAEYSVDVGWGVQEVEYSLDPCRIFKNTGDLASKIDNTLLKPEATLSEAKAWLEKSMGHGFRCHMLPPYHAVRLADELVGERICSVACFPYPFYDEGHCEEAIDALGAAGVWEVDIVAPLHLIRAGLDDEAITWLASLVDVAGEYGMRVKVIVEAPILTDEELLRAVSATAASGGSFVKTSTGVISKGGDPHTVARTYRFASKIGLPVKAAGGIKDVHSATAAIAAGADVLGSSNGLKILEGYTSWCTGR